MLVALVDVGRSVMGFISDWIQTSVATHDYTCAERACQARPPPLCRHRVTGCVDSGSRTVRLPSLWSARTVSLCKTACSPCGIAQWERRERPLTLPLAYIVSRYSICAWLGAPLWSCFFFATHAPRCPGFSSFLPFAPPSARCAAAGAPRSSVSAGWRSA